MEYKITLEVMKHPELGDIEKLFIYYYGGIYNGMREYYGRPNQEPETQIRGGYTKHPDSLPYEDGSNIVSRTISKVIVPASEKKVVIDNVEYKLVENKLSWWRRFLNNFR